MDWKRCSIGPDCVMPMASCKAAVAASPSFVLGVMNPRLMCSCGYVRVRRLDQYSG